jgi:carbon-monoxide dehydrogenase small subunit
MTAADDVRVTLTVNGTERTRDVPPRLLLSDFLRHHLGLTGTHVGCEHGVCGACTVLVDGQAVRSCLMFTAQADGADVRTVESLTENDGSLGPIQAAFRDQHGLQCGFCTPGILMSFAGLRDEAPQASREDVEAVLAGHLCRCTGYRNIMLAAGQVFGFAGDTAESDKPG